MRIPFLISSLKQFLSTLSAFLLIHFTREYFWLTTVPITIQCSLALFSLVFLISSTINWKTSGKIRMARTNFVSWSTPPEIGCWKSVVDNCAASRTKKLEQKSNIEKCIAHRNSIWKFIRWTGVFVTIIVEVELGNCARCVLFWKWNFRCDTHLIRLCVCVCFFSRVRSVLRNNVKKTLIKAFHSLSTVFQMGTSYFYCDKTLRTAKKTTAKKFT